MQTYIYMVIFLFTILITDIPLLSHNCKLWGVFCMLLLCNCLACTVHFHKYLQSLFSTIIFIDIPWLTCKCRGWGIYHMLILCNLDTECIVMMAVLKWLTCDCFTLFPIVPSILIKWIYRIMLLTGNFKQLISNRFQNLSNFCSLSERVGVIDPEQYSTNRQTEEYWYHSRNDRTKLCYNAIKG